MSKPIWIGKDLVGGVPSELRPDRTPPPHWRLESVFATARPHHPALSRDDRRLAFVLDLEGTSDIWALDLNEGRLNRLTTDRGPVAYWMDSSPSWSPDGTTIAYDQAGHVHLVPAEGGPSHRLVGGSTGAWVDDHRMLVVVDRQETSTLAMVDIDDPWPSPLGPRDGDVGRPRLADDGRIALAYWPKEDRNRSDIVVVDQDGSWTTLVGHPGRRAADHCLRGNRVAYTLEDGDRAAIFLTDLDGTSHSRVTGDDRDFSDLVWVGDDSLIAVATSRGRSDLVRVGLDGAVEELAEGGTWSNPLSTDDGIVAIHQGFESPPSLKLLRTAGSIVTVYDGAPAPIRSAPHAKVERVTFSSTDGLAIEGFLFRPADIPRQVPAVVYAHGGPTSHYGDEWDGHAQYFIDKGYAWLAINFRGSTSYGREFERRNHGDWGVGDVEDCIAAAQYLAGLGWVDPTRIAILGGSYGAYLAVSSLVHAHNPFACGVAKYGDCDILTTWAQTDRIGVDDLERMMGHPATNRRAYIAGSPIHRIRRIEKPILIVHGEKDARVHPRQSEELVEALDRIGATYEYITYPTEGHGLLRREPQLHFHRRLERFFDWYLM